MKPEHTAEFCFYGELNDFLPPSQRQQTNRYCFSGHPGIKDPIEVFGVPHTEVELILVNAQSVGFDYQLQNGDRVAVYPVFENLNLGISPVVKLREKPLRKPRFIMDVNLGKLAKHMRLLGFDCLYRNDYSDAEVANIGVNEQRIVLTRDRRLLYASRSSMAIGCVRSMSQTRSMKCCGGSSCTMLFNLLHVAWFAMAYCLRSPRPIFWNAWNPRPAAIMKSSTNALLAGASTGTVLTWKT